MNEETKLKNFAVHLYQTAEVHTETFEVEALDEAEALAKGAELIADKELTGVKHRLEAVDVTPAPAEPVTEPAVTADAPATEAPAQAPAPAGKSGQVVDNPVVPTAPDLPVQTGTVE